MTNHDAQRLDWAFKQVAHAQSEVASAVTNLRHLRDVAPPHTKARLRQATVYADAANDALADLRFALDLLRKE